MLGMHKPFQPKNFYLRRLAAVVLSMLMFLWFYHHVYRRVLIGGQTVVFENVSTKNIVRLRKDFGSGSSKRLQLYFSGNLNGKAVVSRYSENAPRQEYPVGPGKVSLSLEEEWQDPDCSIDYNPESVTAGSLAVRYQFITNRK